MATLKQPLSDFTILAADLLTNEVIAELPGHNLTFASRHKTSQNAGFVVPMGDQRLKKIDIANATRPGRTAIYIDYKGSLVWGGIVWARAYSASAGTLTINGSETLSFYDKQDIPVTLRFKQIDQFEIFRQIIASITALDGGDILLAIDSSLSGVLRDRTYYDFEFKNVGEALLELSNVINGFDYRIIANYNSNHEPQKTLIFGYPRLGVVGGGLTRLFDYPGCLNNYDYPEDAVDFVDDMAAIGEGEGDQMKVGRAINQDLLDQGFPHYSGSYSYKDVSVQSTLDAHAAQDLDDHEHMFKTGTFTLNVDSDPEFGTYLVGDEGRFRLTSDFHPAPSTGGAGFDKSLRIFGWSVNGSTGEVTLEAGSVNPA